MSRLISGAADIGGQGATLSAAQSAAPRGGPDRWSAVVAVGLAVFMAMLDMSVIAVALPAITAGFGASPAVSEWVALAYLLPLIGMTLPAGRWLDRVGTRSALVASTAGFVVASVAAGAAPGIGWLIGARAIQGSFAAVLLALGPVLAATSVRLDRRGRAMSVVTTVGPLGGVSGPVLGGVMVDGPGWAWAFYLNVPVGLVVIAIGLASLPADGRLRWPTRSMITETALLGGAAAALLAGLSLGAGHGFGWLLIAGAAVPPVLVWLRIPASRTVRSLLRVGGMRAPHLALLTEATAVGVVVFLVPFYLQDVKGLSATAAGTVVLAFPVSTMAVSAVAGVLADVCGARRIAVAGTLVFTVGLVATAPLSSGWSAADLAWRLALVGAGAGLFAGPNQTVAMTSAPPRLLGVTGASTSLARQSGFSLGPALATSIWALSGYSTLGVRTSVAVAAGLGLLALLSLTRPDARRGIGRRNPSTNPTKEQ